MGDRIRVKFLRSDGAFNAGDIATPLTREISEALIKAGVAEVDTAPLPVAAPPAPQAPPVRARALLSFDNLNRGDEFSREEAIIARLEKLGAVERVSEPKAQFVPPANKAMQSPQMSTGARAK